MTNHQAMTNPTWPSNTSASGKIPNAEARPGTPEIVNRHARRWDVVRGTAQVVHATPPMAEAVPDGEPLGEPVGTNHVVWRLRQVDERQRDVVDIEFHVRWTFGAAARFGGAFITEAVVEVATCHVADGTRADLAVTTDPPRMTGSRTAPVAVLPLRIHGFVAGEIWEAPVEWQALLHGDGAVV